MRLRAVNWLLLVAVYLFGVAGLAVMPPFEGFDEAEYWSAIQQFADTGKLPRYETARVSQDVARYPGPLPGSAGQPYVTFFAGPQVFATGPSRYAPGGVMNYEAQHPPVFFFLLRPVYQVASGLSWPAHFLVLRLVCWTVAFLGFCLGALATQGVLRRRGYAGAILWLPVAWPFLFPQFFEEFGRITNDSVCLFLVSLSWWLLISHLERGGSWARAIGLGFVLGAGLLTKAFFLPLTAGVAVLLLYAAWQRRCFKDAALALGIVLLAGLVGLWWYVHAWDVTGSFTGASDFIELRQQGGLLAGLARHYPSFFDKVMVAPADYLLGLLRMMFGFCWAGSWSFVHPPRVLFLPVLALAVVPCVVFARRVEKDDLVALAPVFMVAPVLAGLLYHLLGMMAGSGLGSGTPGWFLHLFAGPLALVLALGWRHRFIRWLAGYAAGLDALLAWMQLGFFSGCLPRAGVGAVNVLDAVCFVDVGRLGALGFPGLAFACGLMGVGVLGVAAFWGLSAAMKKRGVDAGSSPA
jgi:hypothetical protein